MKLTKKNVFWHIEAFILILVGIGVITYNLVQLRNDKIEEQAKNIVTEVGIENSDVDAGKVTTSEEVASAFAAIFGSRDTEIEGKALAKEDIVVKAGVSSAIATEDVSEENKVAAEKKKWEEHFRTEFISKTPNIKEIITIQTKAGKKFTGEYYGVVGNLLNLKINDEIQRIKDDNLSMNLRVRYFVKDYVEQHTKRKMKTLYKDVEVDEEAEPASSDEETSTEDDSTSTDEETSTEEDSASTDEEEGNEDSED